MYAISKRVFKVKRVTRAQTGQNDEFSRFLRSRKTTKNQMSALENGKDSIKNSIFVISEMTSKSLRTYLNPCFVTAFRRGEVRDRGLFLLKQNNMKQRIECLKAFIREINKKRTASKQISVNWVNSNK